ncbi:MAG: molybdopterin-dependent oxidoreductase [Candidatus Hodarchaeota archaeon]
MQKRNFYILVVSLLIVISTFWLSIYSFIILEVDPLQNIKNLFGGEDVVVLTIKGNVNRELQLTVSDIKSDRYQQIEDRTFHMINAIGREFDLVFSGACLWSIFEEEDILTIGASTFLFIGGDGYYAETPLSLSLAQNFMEQVILAYEQDGEPLFLDGPIRSVVDYEVIPDKITTHYAIKNLKTILIQ